VFGFDVRLELSTRPEERIGSDELWDRSEAALTEALESQGLEYDLNEGDGAFYGAKIDMHMTDSLGRSWQIGTVQVRLQHAGAVRPELHRRRQRRAPAGHDPPGADGLLRALHRDPARALRGGAAGLAGPVQAVVLPISDRHLEYGASVRERLHELDLRAELDQRTESVSRKDPRRRAAQNPVHADRRDREQDGAVVSVREHGTGDAGSASVDAFAERVRALIKSRSAR